MKSVKNIEFFKNIKQIREFEFGVFYFFEGLVISEMKESTIFSWRMAEKALHAAYEVLGKKTPVTYISNRINGYFIAPTDWIKFYKNRHKLHLYSVVGYTRGNVLSFFLERFFFRKSIRKFNDIEEAIEWSLEKLEAQKLSI